MNRITLIVVVVALAIGVGIGAAVWALSGTKEDVASNTTAIERADEAIRQVQKSRLENCENANERHDNTLEELDRQIAKLPPDRKAEARARQSGTVALIEAIVPRQDCDAIISP